MGQPKAKNKTSASFPKEPKQFLDKNGRFIIEQYHQTKTFTNFFPGIAGLWGIPMWVFYVNRGQCIASFGVEGKDKAIMEFQPANKAYRLTTLQGFRTFLKIKTKRRRPVFYEPFQNNLANSPFKIHQSMAMTSHDLTIEEVNGTLGLKTVVHYFTLPDEPFAALVREVSITNLSSRMIALELIDGMPAIVPFGLNDALLKNISRTVEAWVRMSNLEKKAPYFNLKVVVSDKPYVEPITEGNFYVSFLDGQGNNKLLDPIVDPSHVFGNCSSFVLPENFFTEKSFNVPLRQQVNNKTPCAMSYASFNLSPHRPRKIISLIGHIHDAKELNRIVSRKLSERFISQKKADNQSNIDRIKSFAFTSSSSEMFDLYCEQTFLDNVLRGGLPISIQTKEGRVAFNVFSRKHGDPERDYNFFVIAPTFLSQGNGNYRDVNQNRRNDVLFNRDVKEDAIVSFLSLIQADGYNPLVVEGAKFSVADTQRVEKVLKHHLESKDRVPVKKLLEKEFQPGELLRSMNQREIKLKSTPKEFLTQILLCCQKQEGARHAEGFWTDHWTYNLDLIESFLSVYPDKNKHLLLDLRSFSFYHNSFYILPRDQRYVLTPRGCRQYHSVADGAEEINVEDDRKLRIHNGEGPVFHTNLLGKLLCIIANKVATLDPSGIGIEMEADKPNWYDALNGLPGLLGSSLCETFELQRLTRFLIDTINKVSLPESLEEMIFEELYTFIGSLMQLLSNEEDNLSFWMRSNEVKEHYRSAVRHGINGLEKGMTLYEIKQFLQLVERKTSKAIASGRDKKGRYLSYFRHEITEYEKLDKMNPQGFSYVWPLDFERKALPLFLEGFVHALRVERREKKARAIYQSVCRSNLFDRKLKMFMVNEDLSKESEEIGRTRIFPAGWLENQSIWIHMEYKFFLELLRCGLYKEFYENLKNAVIPFLPPEKYGRSPLENSSFIVSSAHPEADLHGRGFVARLSGSTAEFVHIWSVMNAGLNPFQVNSHGQLILQFKPALVGWLFSKEKKEKMFFVGQKKWQKVSLPKNSYAFNFLGSTLVVYHNPQRRDTFGEKRAETRTISLSYSHRKEPIIISSEVISSPYAQDVRDGKVERVDIFMK